MRVLLAVLLGLFALTTAPTAALATVTSSTRSVEYTPGSPTTRFAVTFSFHDADWLRVTKTHIASGVATTLVYGTDYTVTLPVPFYATNGMVTTTASVVSGYRLKIERDLDATQTTSFSTQGTFVPRLHEKAFDKLTILVQELAAGALSAGDAAAAIASHIAGADPHTQYALLAGRSGGQSLRGGTGSGETLTLSSTNHATKGKVYLGAALASAFDEVNGRLGIGTAAPSYTLDVSGAARFGSGILATGGNLYETTSNGILGIFGGQSSDFNMAGLALYGGSHASSNYADLLCAICRIYSNTGTLRWSFSANGMFGASGQYISLVNGGIYTDNSPVQVLRLDGGSASVPGAYIKLYPSTAASQEIEMQAARVTFTHYGSGTAFGFLYPFSVGSGTTALGSVSYLYSHLSAKRPVTAADIAETVTTADCNSIVYAATNNTVIQLPDITNASGTGNTAGCEITVIVSAADTTAQVSISPHSSDGIEGHCIGGPTGAGNATYYEFSGTANKDVRWTAANQRKGDTMTLTSDITGTWYVTECYGLAESEP